MRSKKTIKAAGEYLVEEYYDTVCKLCRRWRNDDHTTPDDIAQTWMMQMLHLITHVWNPKEETMKHFIASRWYNTVGNAWRAEHGILPNHTKPPKKYGTAKSLDQLLDKVEDFTKAPPIYYDFEEYEEFEILVSKLPDKMSRMLRDRVYLNLSGRELAEKYGITSGSASTLICEAYALYREAFREYHKDKSD